MHDPQTDKDYDGFILSEIRRVSADLKLLSERKHEIELMMEQHKALISALQDQCDHDWQDRGGFMYAQWECKKCGAWATE